jgi:hypothetical protein
MDFTINYKGNENIKIDNSKFQKMVLLYNAIEEGWTVKRKNETYVFIKNHEGKKEILLDTYLDKFMKTNLNLNDILHE